MIFTNLTMLFLYLNISTNVDYDTTGLVRIDYRDEWRTSYYGWMTPVYGGRGVMSLWIPHEEKSLVINVIEHELKHLKAWRTNKSCYVENFIKHGDCFEKAKIVKKNESHFNN